MSEQPVKLSPNDEIVKLQRWYEVVESPEFHQTVLASLDKRLDELAREKEVLKTKLSGLDFLVSSGQIDARIDEINLWKKFYGRKSRKYQRNLKGE